MSGDFVVRAFAAGLALAVGLACSEAGAGTEGAGSEAPGLSTRAGESVARSARALQEPGLEDLLIAPPSGAEYQAESSALESEGEGGQGPSRYGTGGGFEAEASYTYVFLTDQSIEEVVRHFERAAPDSPYYIDLGDAYADYATQELEIEEEPAAPMPPDAMAAMIEQYRDQGMFTEEEAEEALADMDLYREIYPKIKDLTIRSIGFTIEQDPEDRDEYRTVDVEIVRPYIDPAIMDVQDRTGILYTVHHMRRVDD